LSTTAQWQTYRGVQVMRFVAALMVLVSHATAVVADKHLSLLVPRWVNGHSGVDIFFVISGFVMYSSCAGGEAEEGAWKRFALKRIARVVPLYWIATTAKLVLLLAAPWATQSSGISIRHVLASYAFLPQLFPVGTPVPVLPVGWTLNFEMFFYAMCAIALYWHRRPLSIVGPAFAILAVLGISSHVTGPMETTYANPLLLEFLAGMFVAKYAETLRQLHWPIAVLALIAGMLGDLLIDADGATSRVLLWGGASAIAVAGAVSLESRIRAHIGRRLLLLGDASYALYLVHTFVVPALTIIAIKRGGIGPWSLIALTILCSVAASVAVFRYVESPIGTHLKTWINRLAPPVPKTGDRLARCAARGPVASPTN
jgi:exopolysaccharide production protein ExoZ